MDALRNPFSPGAGTAPPQLAGRHHLVEQARIALARHAAGRAAKSPILIGLRGVGKTVLLNRMQVDAEDADVVTIQIEAPGSQSLPAALAPELHAALQRISKRAAASALAHRALSALAGFVAAWKITYQDIGLQLDVDPEPGLANNGHLESDLRDLMLAVGAAAKSAETSVAIFIDELQYVDRQELAALTAALHRSAQRQTPLTLVAAGLPQLRAQLGDAKSYAERLFDFTELGALDGTDAADAIAAPLDDEDVEIERDALDAIIEEARGYPYFLQEWGKHVWEAAERSPITSMDVKRAEPRILEALDESFFRVRFDRCTTSQQRYLRAMADLGPGPHRSGEIAKRCDRGVNQVAPIRRSLIEEGMIWSPGYGETAFTAPLFDEFMLRIMPEFK